MKRVIIESPYAADTPQGINLNEIYGELCMHDCLVNHNEAPYASHLLYTRDFVLRDEIPEDRKLGIEAGFYWRDVAEKTVFYVDMGITSGMNLGIQDCETKEKSYELRALPENLWKRFDIICRSRGYGRPERNKNE